MNPSHERFDLTPHVRNAFVSIILFIILYLILLILAIALAIGCAFAGLALIISYPHPIAILVGAGIVVFGAFTLYYLVKFLFAKVKTDNSGRVEITAANEPELFRIINDVASKTGNPPPKHVYVTAEVNAAVIYNSNFRSLFFRESKNLIIGVGLLNTCTVAELRAIIAHEFGHFSQDSMRVGSYVYQANKIIHDLLFNNEGYHNALQTVASASSFIGVFVQLSVAIANGIRRLLTLAYNIVYKRYMSLSREMEFEADMVAAKLCGGIHLSECLTRMELAQYSLQASANYYFQNADRKRISQNIFADQLKHMFLQAEITELSIVNSLPHVKKEEIGRYNRSKLSIENQWASHPELNDRIERIVNITANAEFGNQEVLNRPANEIIRNLNRYHTHFTQQLFQDIPDVKTFTPVDADTFDKEIRTDYQENSFSKFYNNYYDYRNPILNAEVAQRVSVPALSKSAELFSDEQMENVYHWISLNGDIETVRQIATVETDIKTFDYSGVKYKKNQAAELLPKLEAEQKKCEEKLQEYDMTIYVHFLNNEKSLGGEQLLKTMYEELTDYDKFVTGQVEFLQGMLKDTAFTSEQTQMDDIRANFRKLKPDEELLKKLIQTILTDSVYAQHIRDELRTKFTDYIAKDQVYFIQNMYQNNALELLFHSIHGAAEVLNKRYFKQKKNILEYQEKLAIK